MGGSPSAGSHEGVRVSVRGVDSTPGNQVQRSAEEPVVKTRRLLVMAYYFPPYGGGFSIRIGKFAKYLSRLGWECTVISVSPESYSPDVAVTGAEPDGAAVHRTPSFERLLPGAGGTAPAGGGGAPAPAGVLQRLKHFVLLPDRQVLWTPYALRLARRLHRERPFDAALATAPPMSTIPAAAALRRLLGIPAVLDLRDDWTGTASFAALPPARQRVERVLERAALRRMDHVLVPTRPSYDRLLSAFALPADRVSFLPNGFDPEDFASPGAGGEEGALFPGRTTLVHLGILTERRSPATLLEALRRLRERDPAAAGRLRFLQMGAVESCFDAALQPMVASGLAEVRPAGPHAEALEVMHAADVLVLIPNQATATAIPGKTYEYLASRRPVLALVEPGATRDLLREVGVRWLLDVDDVDAITSALAAIAADPPRRDEPEPMDADVLRRYDRGEQARQLAEVLDRLTRG
jgi:glycosyltransferase involved in cell wall biosynthesis